MSKNRRAFVVLLLAACAVGLSIDFLCSRPGLAANGESAAQMAKWQYAEFKESNFHGDEGVIWSFNDGKKEAIKSKDFEDFAKQLGAKSKGGGYAGVLNLLGADGWELIMMQKDNGGALGIDTATYRFKRRAN